MRKLWKIILIVAVFALVGTYVIYALEYQGNYNCTASMMVSADTSTLTNLYVTEFKVTSEPTSPVQFWDVFTSRPPGTPSWEYTLYAELNQSGVRVGDVQSLPIIFPPGRTGPQSISVEFKNISPGSATIHVYIINAAMQTSVFDHTYSVVIGP